jgi:hypothetical protein
MSPGVFTIPRTPSGFHESARRRAAACPRHDAMQQEVLAFLRGRTIAGAPKGAFILHEVEAEKPFTRNGQVIAYADAMETIQVNLFRSVNVFEIKPRIETVFGILRQVKGLLELARKEVPGDMHFGHVVVPADDPRLAEMRAEWPNTWAWGQDCSERAEGPDE